MKQFSTFLFTLFALSLFAQPAQYKPTAPQVVYEMYIEVVEPIHNIYDNLNLSTHKPHIKGSQLEAMFKESSNKLETFHKDRLHRDSYTAAKNYLAGISDVNAQLIPVLNKIHDADPAADISPWLEEMHDITIQEKHYADEYRTAILKVIELFKKEFDTWLEAEVVYFSRLTAQDRNRLYETGFGEDGLRAVKRRFYTAEYFVVNMEHDVTDSRVNTIKASFHDLSQLPEWMINDTDEFVKHMDKVMEQYRYEKTVDGKKITYAKAHETNFEFVVKKIEVKIISKSSNTLSVKFYY